MKPLFLFTTSSIFILLIGCGANQSEKDMAVNTADTASITGFTGDSVKLIKTAGITIKVKDVHQSVRAVSQLAQRLGGLISHENIETTEDGTKRLKISDDSILVIAAYATHAAMTARVPAQNLEAFLYTAADLGYYTANSSMDIDDKSLLYLANQLKQENRLQVIKTKDEVIEQEITNRQMNADARYSTVQLSLFQNLLVRREIMANDAIADYHLSFSKSLSNALSAGWELFLNFIIALSHLWVFISITIAGWLMFKYYHYKRKTRLIKG